MATDASAINEPLALRARSRRYLGQARDYLSMGELSDACERGYEAAVVIVRAAALQRGIPCETDYELHRALSRIADDTGDIQFVMLFCHPEVLHRNASDDWMSESHIGHTLDLVATFIERMGRLVLDAA